MIRIIQTGTRVTAHWKEDGSVDKISADVEPPEEGATILFVDMPDRADGWMSITWKVELP